MDWKATEEAWVREAANGIAGIASAHPKERIYAAAFWLFYGDHGKLLAPAFAVNAESHVAQQDADAEYSTRWVPSEWRWDVVDAVVPSMKPHYEPLLRIDSGYDALEQRHFEMIARVCRRLTAAARCRTSKLGDAHLPSDFVVALIHDQDGDDTYQELVRASVEPAILKSLPDILVGA